MGNKVIINAAITGMVPRKQDNASVPISIEEIIAQARRVQNAGAAIVHLHARDEQGRPTCDEPIHRRMVQGVRQACPGLVICGSTSGRTHQLFEQRAVVLDCKPDMASLTLGSMNFPSGASINEPAMIAQLASRMHERGILPELECFDLGMIDYARDHLLRKGIINRPLFFNLLLGSLGTAAATRENLAYMVKVLPQGSQWSGAGIGRYQLAVNRMALEMGGHVRVGLEDNLWMDEQKTQPATNVMLVERVVKMARTIGREPATAAQARQIIGLDPA